MKKIYISLLLSLLIAGCDKFEDSSEYLTREEIIYVKNVVLSKNTLSLTRGSTYKLTATVSPPNSTNTALVWSSSDERIAKVTDGVVTAVAVGTAIISVSTSNGSGVKATCIVRVGNKPVTSITLSKISIELFTGKSMKLIATLSPSDADNKSVEWTSSDKNVVTVNDGLVTAVSVGTATVTAIAADGSGVRATCQVTVRNILVTSIVLSESSVILTNGISKELTYTVLPVDATDKSVTYESSDNGVAYYAYSTVNPVNAGSAIITFTANDGSGVKATCMVEVNPGTIGTNNGYEWIDLGLPSGIKWATKDVGANSYEEDGDCFAWGETVAKTGFSLNSYKYYDSESETYTKYNPTDGKTVLDIEDDAAYKNWGGTWRMPTYDELKELRNKCKWSYDNSIGRYGGYTIIGPNKNHIFLTISCYPTGVQTYEYAGLYWSSSLFPWEVDNDEEYGMRLYLPWKASYFNVRDVEIHGYSRFVRGKIRPVCP